MYHKLDLVHMYVPEIPCIGKCPTKTLHSQNHESKLFWFPQNLVLQSKTQAHDFNQVNL